MIQETVTGRVVKITLPPGRLDGGELDRRLSLVVSRHLEVHQHHLFIDLAKVTVITQPGLLTLMDLDQRCRRYGYARGNGGGRLYLCRPSKAIKTFLENGQKYHNFSIHATMAAAKKVQPGAE